MKAIKNFEKWFPFTKFTLAIDFFEDFNKKFIKFNVIDKTILYKISVNPIMLWHRILYEFNWILI